MVHAILARDFVSPNVGPAFKNLVSSWFMPPSPKLPFWRTKMPRFKPSHDHNGTDTMIPFGRSITWFTGHNLVLSTSSEAQIETFVLLFAALLSPDTPLYLVELLEKVFYYQFHACSVDRSRVANTLVARPACLNWRSDRSPRRRRLRLFALSMLTPMARPGDAFVVIPWPFQGIFVS
jgi:hypothetical protein